MSVFSAVHECQTVQTWLWLISHSANAPQSKKVNIAQPQAFFLGNCVLSVHESKVFTAPSLLVTVLNHQC